jgi:hypothetical protein
MLHLRLWMRCLHARLAEMVERRSRTHAELRPPGVSALVISPEQARLQLGQCERSLAGECSGVSQNDSNEAFESAREDLRQAARRAGEFLPLEQLQEALGLSDFEVQAIVLCAMPELDGGYERIFAFLQDDLSRRMPGAAMIASLLEPTLEAQLLSRQRLSRYARLLRRGVLEEAPRFHEGPEELLRLGPGALAYLCGGGDPASLFADPLAVSQEGRRPLPGLLAGELLQRLAASLRSGQVRLAAFWGPRHAHVEEAVRQAAMEAGLPLFRCPATASSEADCRALLQTAWCEKAALWLDCGRLFGDASPSLRDVWLDALRRSAVPVFLTGERPWRPIELIERGYWETELRPANVAERTRQWRVLFPMLTGEEAAGLAGRFRMSWTEMQAAERLATSSTADDGRQDRTGRIVEACSLVLRRESAQFADIIIPSRGPESLILLEPLHKQVRELADFHLAQSRVYEAWGFDKVVTGRGVKAFFSGEPGTGKTLAAEVVARMVGLPLLKVDLSRLVSKWVGETEKHLECVFSEAEQSHYVLFLDECDALGGKRGEVRTGSDKFANLETAYLLQRMESFYGLAILASNLKDQLDDALLRRFQVVVHFPMPAVPERRRLWQLALSHGAPVQPLLQFDALAQLEMSGAAIMNAATAAALLAASEGSATITAEHLLRGVARQFERESRILSQNLIGQIGAQIRAMA